MEIKNFTQTHFKEVCTIYQQGIDTGIATFQTDIPTWEEWHKSHLTFGRLGMFENNGLMGWCSLSPVSSRCVYHGVAEVSIYIGLQYTNQGIATALLKELITESENNGIWTLQSSVFSENYPSIRVHLKCGFRVVGTREKIGMKNGIWKDNLLLEKRSQKTGVSL